MNVNGNFKDNLMGKKKVIFIGCLIFAVALIAAILHMVSGVGKDSAKNTLLRGQGQRDHRKRKRNREPICRRCGGAGYFENLTFRRTESERDFRGKRAGSGAWDETL